MSSYILRVTDRAFTRYVHEEPLEAGTDAAAIAAMKAYAKRVPRNRSVFLFSSAVERSIASEQGSLGPAS